MATRASIRTQVARALGCLLYTGTVDSATATTLVDSVLTFANNDDLNGKQVAITGGLGIGQRRTITASTAASDQITVATWTTTPDVTSTYDVYDTAIATCEQLDDYIDSATRSKQQWALVDVVDTRLVTGDILRGSGSFQQPFTSGVADSFGGVTIAKSTNGTFTRETTVIYRISPQDVACQKIVSDGTNAAYLEFTIPDWAVYAGETLTVTGRVYVNTTARVSIQLLDGVTTTSVGEDTGTSVTTTSDWIEVSQDIAVGAAPTQLLVRCNITSGTAVTAYFHHVRLITSKGFVYEMPIPQDTSANLAFINRVDIESSTEGSFWQLTDDSWRIHHGSTPLLSLMRYTITRNDIAVDTSPVVTSNRKIRIFGQELPSLPTADGDSLEALDEYVKSYAIYLGHLAAIPRTEKIPVWQLQVTEARDIARRLEAPVPRAPNSRAVRRVE